MYARYFDSDRKIQTAFIGMSEVSDGSAKTIVGVLRQLCDREQLNIDHKLVAFGSEGAAVMTGGRGGVAILLKVDHPGLLPTAVLPIG